MKDTRITLVRRSPLQLDLTRRVQAYFTDRGIAQQGGRRIILKTAIIFTWWTASFALAVFGGLGLAGTLLCAVSLGLAAAGIGFNVMHDGNHGAYSSNQRLNRAMGFSVDVMGGSSYLWRHKHNVIHHTYPNVVGTDDDIDVGVLARMAPDQPHLPLHRWQHIYMWPLYAFIAIKWHWRDDFVQIAQAKIGPFHVPRPKGGDLWTFIIGRALFFTWSLVVPMMVLGVAQGLLVYLVAMFSLGVALAVVFQLAHCVEEAEFPSTTGLSAAAPVEKEFVRMQLDSTVDFARGNPVVTWFLGGLNYQTVHHLFPRISHVHYPALSRIVEQVCAEHGVAYRTTGTFRQALASHYRWLKRMGQGEGVVTAVKTPVVSPEVSAGLATAGLNAASVVAPGLESKGALAAG